MNAAAMLSFFLRFVPLAAAVAAIPLGSAASALVHVPTRTARVSSPLLAIGSRGSSTAEDPYEVLRAGYDRRQLTSFFMKRPVALMGRAAKFARVYKKLQRVWLREEALPATERTRGDVLRTEISALGPVAVKLGQTLSQRPDIVGVDVCEALKSLQTSNAPFDNERAWQVLREELGAHGRPIAPGPTFVDGTTDPNAPPVFARLSEQPIASASLGQVYRGQTHDGREVAVKVQRPGAVRQVALDFAVLIVGLQMIAASGWGNGDLDEILDTCAQGVFEELDYRNEARNAAEFKSSMSFLGYVDVPDFLLEYTQGSPTQGSRVLVSEWVYGRHLDKLSREEGLRMTYMAVEAVTASLVLTGIVHADPHEGNLMLADDGRLVFLDFGLMSRVQPQIMEAFAYGIQCVLNEDWDGLVIAFIKSGFVGSPIEARENVKAPFRPAGSDAQQRMASELRAKMGACPGGTSRFGALSTVLFDMGKLWRMYSPPYIILLIRTFLTLEGIAGQVDPNFNIYEVSLPWALRRALSPSTEDGARQLRSSILTADNQLQWEKIMTLLRDALSSSSDGSSSSSDGSSSSSDEQRSAAAAAAERSTAAVAAAAATAARAAAAAPHVGSGPGRASEGVVLQTGMGHVGSSAGPSKLAKLAGSGAATPMESVMELLGSPEGIHLRRIANDLDSTELLLRLASPRGEARVLRHLTTEAIAKALTPLLRSCTSRLRQAALMPLRGLRRAGGHATALATTLMRRPEETDTPMSPQTDTPRTPQTDTPMSPQTDTPMTPQTDTPMALTTAARELAAGAARQAARVGEAAGEARLRVGEAAGEARLIVGEARQRLSAQWPRSPKSLKLRSRRLTRSATVYGVLLRTHLRRQLTSGWRGGVAALSLVYLAVRVGALGVLKAALRSGAAVPGIAVIAASLAVYVRARPVHAGFVVLAGGILALGAATQQRPPEASEEEVVEEAAEGL